MSEPDNIMGQTLRAAGPRAGVEIAQVAARYGLKPDDPAWIIALAVHDADTARGAAIQAAQATAQASAQVVKAITQIEERVLKGASQAGQDTAGVIRIESAQVAEALKAAVAEAAKGAAARLAKAAAAKGPDIIDEWKRELTHVARLETRRSLLRNGILGAALALACAGLGAGGLYWYLRGRILPEKYVLTYLSGKPDCGALATGSEVCGVTMAPH